MAKFVFFLPRYHTNAVPWMRVLAEAGQEVTVLVSHRGNTESYEIVQPQVLPRSRLDARKASRPIEVMPSVRYVWRKLREELPDVVIIRGLNRAQGLVALACALAQRRRVVIYDQEPLVPRSVGTKLRRALMKVFGVPHVSVKLAPHQPGGIANAIALPFGLPFGGRIPARLPRTGETPVRILMVAKYRERKGHITMLRAFANLSTQYRLILSFCGEEVTDYDRRYVNFLRRVASDLGVSDLVGFNNNVPYDRMDQIYSEHDIVVLPSINEPAAISPIEAACSGCAVVITADSGTRGYIPSGGRFEFEAGNHADLARALGDLLSSETSLASAKTQCLDHVRQVAGDSVVLQSFMQLLGNDGKE